MTFSYLAFIHNPVRSLAFFALIMTFLSLWIHKRAWLYLSFFCLAFIFALHDQLIDPIALIALAALVLCIKSFCKNLVHLSQSDIALTLDNFHSNCLRAPRFVRQKNPGTNFYKNFLYKVLVLCTQSFCKNLPHLSQSDVALALDNFHSSCLRAPRFVRQKNLGANFHKNFLYKVLV
jgi:hypothetical protein